MSTEGIIFRLVAHVLPYITLGIFAGGIAWRARRWLKIGNWSRARSPLVKWLPQFVKGTVSNLILFMKIYKRRKIFWLLSFGFHIIVFMILFGHLRGFGVWSKEILQKIGPDFTKFMVEILPLYLGVISTILLIGLLIYRMANRTLRLQSEPEDYLVTVLVLLTVASGTVMRILPPDSFNSMAIKFLPGIVLEIEKTPNLLSLMIHVVAAQFLIMYLPFSKLIHVISAIVNMAYSSIETTAEKVLYPSSKYVEKVEIRERQDIEAGVDLSTLPGRYVLALETCVACGNCTLNCPTYTLSEEKAHIPGVRLRGILRAFNQGSLIYRIFGRTIDKQILEKMIWECALCGYCSENCPLVIRTDLIYLAARSALADATWIPKPLAELSKIIRESHNPLGRDNKDRNGWIKFRLSKNSRMIKKLGVEAALKYVELGEEMLMKNRAETVYFVGCNASFFKALSGVPDAMVHILKAVGEDFTILGEDEWCCGYPLLLAGDIKGFKEVAMHNIEAIRARGARRVVFTCAGCYRVFKQFYGKLLNVELDFEVLHSTQLLHMLCVQGKLKPVESKIMVTYHDPCDIGRHGHIYLEPRRTLEFIGCELVEMEKTGDESLCCGGGGLLKSSNLDLSSKIAVERAKQAARTGAKLIVTACPSCELSLREGIQAIKESKLKVLDIVEVVAIQTGLLPPS